MFLRVAHKFSTTGARTWCRIHARSGWASEYFCNEGDGLWKRSDDDRRYKPKIRLSRHGTSRDGGDGTSRAGCWEIGTDPLSARAIWMAQQVPSCAAEIISAESDRQVVPGRSPQSNRAKRISGQHLRCHEQCRTTPGAEAIIGIQ